MTQFTSRHIAERITGKESELSKLAKNIEACISSTFSSADRNAIERYFNTYYRSQLSQLMLTRNKEQKKIDSFINSIAFYQNNLNELFPLTEVRIQVLHYNLYYGKNDDQKNNLSAYRKNKVIVYGSVFLPSEKTKNKKGVVIGRCVNFSKIKEQMSLLINKFNIRLISEDNPFQTVSWLHQHIATIHPFPDGNGRLARALYFLALVHISPEFKRLSKLLNIPLYLEWYRGRLTDELCKLSQRKSVYSIESHSTQFNEVFLTLLYQSLQDINKFLKNYQILSNLDL